MKSGINLEAMDRSVRPQDDLFGFVNGSWIANTEIPSDRGRYGTFDMLREEAEGHLHELLTEAGAEDVPEDAAPTAGRKAGDLFASFMDEARVEELGVTPLRPDLEAIDSVMNVPGLLRVMGQLQRHGVAGAVIPFINTDARASDRYIAYFEQAGLGLPDESYYREERHEGVRTAYVPHVARMLGHLGVDAAQDAADRVMALETRLAKSHWDNVATRDAVKTYTKVDAAGLRDLAPGVDWDAWREGLGVAADALDEVVVRQPSYLAGLAEALEQVPLDDWKLWLRWQLVHAYAAYLSGDLVTEDFEFFGRKLTGATELRKRWKRGVSLVEEAAGEAAGQLYVEKYFPPEAKARMLNLVENLVAAYRRNISSLTWMGEETRAKALEKLEAFTPKIGYPDRWRDYSALEVDRSDLLGNVRRANAFELDRDFGKLGKPIDRDEWFMSPQTVNAYYNPGMNEIVFPAAILQPPFFDLEADDAVNYGAIGSVIGHEVGHGFDDQGSRYDGAGNLVDWWTQEDRERFEALTGALIKQYDAFELRDYPGNTVNGALTVGENIGDLGGLTIGYEAWRIATEGAPSPEIDGFTGAQRVFAGWAQVWKGKAREESALQLLQIDPHSPAEFRANIARNLTEFYDAFDVVEGDDLWLPEEERVRIW
jgi:putative endopeptidase